MYMYVYINMYMYACIQMGEHSNIYGPTVCIYPHLWPLIPLEEATLEYYREPCVSLDL